MDNEFMKRGYLLPQGCKDLSDSALLDHKQPPEVIWPHWRHNYTACNPTKKSPTQFPPLPPITRQVFIPPHTTVKKLAALLDLKPFEIVGDLLILGIFAMTDFLLDFKTISVVAKMHGYLAIKSG